MCIICDCKDDYSSISNRTTINCSKCPNVTMIPVLPNLQQLVCQECPSLVQISACPNLQLVYCDLCPRLTVIYTLPNLQQLFCDNCHSLTSITECPNLQEIACFNCVSLTTIKDVLHLRKINCQYCRLLLSLPPCDRIIATGCVWLCRPNQLCFWFLAETLQRKRLLIRLQRWWRHKYWKRNMFKHRLYWKYFKGCQDVIQVLNSYSDKIRSKCLTTTIMSSSSS